MAPSSTCCQTQWAGRIMLPYLKLPPPTVRRKALCYKFLTSFLVRDLQSGRLPAGHQTIKQQHSGVICNTLGKSQRPNSGQHCDYLARWVLIISMPFDKRSRGRRLLKCRPTLRKTVTDTPLKVAAECAAKSQPYCFWIADTAALLQA